MIADMHERLVAWFHANKRDLPWRRDPSPYAVLVSEFMLQQTRVETVIPYFETWMRRFPTLASVAAAPLEEVYSVWQGLGYYRRARNLHRCAQVLRDSYNGVIPGEPQALRELPGVGPYTSGAIASIAFQCPVPAIDGNVIRVVSRVAEIATPVNQAGAQREIHDFAARLVAIGDPSSTNQAIMELGATVCTPRNPSCATCPLGAICRARASDRVYELPVAATKARARLVEMCAIIVGTTEGSVLLAQREADGLLGGLWEPPMLEVRGGADVGATLRRALGSVPSHRALAPVIHVFTHIRMTIHPIIIDDDPGAIVQKWADALLSGVHGPAYASMYAHNARARAELPLSRMARKVLLAAET